MRFKARLASNPQLLRALENVHEVLTEVAQYDELDTKLAEYCFFPLTPIFNETQRASAQCLEISLRCLEILILKGWGSDMQAAFAKQLLILLTLLAGGTLGQSVTFSPQSEGLTVAAIDCMKAAFTVLSDVAASSLLDEIAPTTIIDQAMYVLLDKLMDSDSDAVQLAAVQSLIILDRRISNRVVLASVLPRTVSSLTKALTPTIEKRRAYFVLRESLVALRDVLEKTMNDEANKKVESQEQSGVKNLVLDSSWRKATAGQIKMAIANVIRLRNHDRWDVREQLALLCEMVCRKCHDTLSESIPMVVETLVVLASVDGNDPANKANDILRQLLEDSEEVRDLLKSSVYNWSIALPRAIQESNSKQKEYALQRISYGFKSMKQLDISGDLLDSTLANSICDAAAVLMKSLAKSHRVEPFPIEIDLEALQGSKAVSTIVPIVEETGGRVLFSTDLQHLIQQICDNDESLSFTRIMLDRTLDAPGGSALETFWVSVMMLKGTIPEVYKNAGNPKLNGETSRTEIWSTLVDDLYSYSLPILTEFSPIGDFDWRIPSLALEVVALQALQLGPRFSPELIDVLYPILQVLTTANPILKRHALDCLNVIVYSCGYQSASDLLIGNVDYLVNAVSLKLNAFDVSPQAPRVLLLMIQLCGPNLIPFLDDLIASIFAILDAYHGYPKLSETMFAVLGAIVSKGVESSHQLTLTEGESTSGESEFRPSYQGRNLDDVVQSIERRKKRLDDVMQAKFILEDEEADDVPQRPLGPLSSDMLNDKVDDGHEENFEYHEEEDTEVLPAPQEEKKELSASHQLLLTIVKSIPSHMTSPSPILRKNLLKIMRDSFTFLSKHEDTFLPLINDLWPTVSARIALSASIMGHAPLLTANDDQRIQRLNVDQFGITEEVYVVADACSTIDIMIRTAKNFMVKRLEDEFPRWKKLYNQVWKEVKNDAERKRQQQHREPSIMTSLPEVSSTKIVATSHDRTTQAAKASDFVPYSHPTAGKAFTPHHTIWKSFNELFATMLKYLRLSDDISWEICHMLGESVAYFKPDYYFSGNWASSEDNSDRVVSAMDHYNKDLTWYIFEKANGGNNIGNGRRDLYIQTLRRMNERLECLREPASDTCPSRWAFKKFNA